jgi:hypothetical protein
MTPGFYCIRNNSLVSTLGTLDRGTNLAQRYSLPSAAQWLVCIDLQRANQQLRVYYSLGHASF